MRNGRGSRQIDSRRFSNSIAMKRYNPHPRDLSSINLPAELDALVEALAENVHDLWARSRMDSGWTYGPERDDAKKTNPCLVPYGELPESEKTYDRDTALATIKFIIADGWRITNESENGVRDNSPQEANFSHYIH